LWNVSQQYNAVLKKYHAALHDFATFVLERSEDRPD
jgi:hypothetical protein